MPPCVCGLKVDRNKDKLSCIICSQLFHPECCNFKPEEIVFAKNTFKCVSCVRRSPFSQDNNLTAKSLDMDIGGADVQISTALTVDCASGSDFPIILDDPIDASALLQLLLKDFAEIKASNRKLREEVSALRKENSSLLSKVDSLETSLDLIKNASPSCSVPSADSSPKRKKKNSNATNHGLTNAFSNNISNFPMLHNNGASGATASPFGPAATANLSCASVSRPLFPVAAGTSAVTKDIGWNTVMKKNARTPVAEPRQTRKPLVVG